MADAGMGAYDSGQGTFGFKATADGKVTLGNTSDDVLHITGTVEQLGTSFKISGDDARVKINGDTDSHPGLELYENDTRKWIIFNNFGDDSLDFKAGSEVNPAMVINANGKVGIGTASPSTTLDVDGDAKFSEEVIHGTTTTDLGNGTSSTLTPASSVHLLTATSITGNIGMHTMSLASGTTAGQILQLIMTTATNGQGIMISTSNILSGGNKISFIAIEPDMLGAALKFIWTGSAWALVSNNVLASVSQ
jgi:hypothetical protein